MTLRNEVEYQAALARAFAMTDAPPESVEYAERAGLLAEIRAWEASRGGEAKHGPEPVAGLTRPDDWNVSGLPGSLGKLKRD